MKKPNILLVCICIVLALQSCLISRIDRTPYQETDYYTKFNQQFNQLAIDTLQKGSDTIKAGWAKVNITPSYSVSLAGYGSRKGKNFTSVHDSIWARAFVFDNGLGKSAFVTLDMLIVPPEITEALTLQLPGIGFSINQTYLSATHTHHSIGGWAKKLVGRLISGKYKKKVIEDVTGQIIQAIKLADANKQTAQFGYAQFDARELVNHRITPEGNVDPWLKVFKIEQIGGQTAALITFSAHATCLASKDYALSRDYPGELVDILEKNKITGFAAFAAGGVGSHSPAAPGSDYEKITNMANGLSQKIEAGFDTISLFYQTKLTSVQLPLPLRKPQWRISENLRLRPWLFYGLYGDYPSTITALKIGNITWIGAPCDFSGELTLHIQKNYKQPLLVTSFNGGYIGYITDDSYYDNPHYETRVMNWFGPENGAYFTEAISQLLNKL